jgi:hypothetical protein
VVKKKAKRRTKPKVYLETSIIGHLASRPSRDLITAAHQQITHDWWHRHRSDFDLYVSAPVLRESRAGDAEAAKEREAFLEGIKELEANDEAAALADELVRQHLLPPKAEADASHIALAVVHHMDYLLTWNCRHIANASLRASVEATCRAAGYQPPIICTPEELLEELR